MAFFIFTCVLYLIAIVFYLGLNYLDEFYNNGGSMLRYELGRCDSRGNPIKQ